MALALLDGDIIAYRAAYGMATTYDWGDTGGKVTVADAKGAAAEAVKLAHQWADAVGATDIMVALTGQEKFRRRVLPTYGANRKGAKPAAHGATVEALKRAFNWQLIEGLEADDVLGILATTDKYRDTAVIVTIDKDLRTIPGRHFNPNKDTTIRTVRPLEADHWWMMQTLMGDSTDGYAGCPGIGEKRAHAILSCTPSLAYMWARVVEAFRSKKLTEDDALVQARMARILRREDYDKDTKEIILWHPVSPTRIPLVSVTADDTLSASLSVLTAS